MGNMSDLDVLVPKPFIHKVAGEELRQQALPIRKLIAVVRFVESNKDLFEKFQLLGKTDDAGGLSFSALLEKDVYTRVYALLRMLLPDQEKLLTDEWCMDHLSNAHIVAIMKTALVQNELNDLFTKAKDLLGPTFLQLLRQNMPKEAPAPTLQN
jgi:hypothetical protein